MGGFSHALWLWLPLLFYKAVSALLRTVWKFNLWVLQQICGVPLYYCKPEYRIPGIFFGTIGLISIFNFIAFLLIASSGIEGAAPKQSIPFSEMLMMLGIGVGFIVLCRFLIRKGSI